MNRTLFDLALLASSSFSIGIGVTLTFLMLTDNQVLALALSLIVAIPTGCILGFVIGKHRKSRLLREVA